MNNKLKILIVSPRSNPKYGLENFYEAAFIKLGHTVHLISADRSLSSLASFSGIRKRMQQRLSRLSYLGNKPDLEAEHLIIAAKNIRPDLTIIVRGERLVARTLGELRRLSTMGCVNIYTDHPFVIPGPGAVQMADSLAMYSVVFSSTRSLIPVFYQ